MTPVTSAVLCESRAPLLSALRAPRVSLFLERSTEVNALLTRFVRFVCSNWTYLRTLRECLRQCSDASHISFVVRVPVAVFAVLEGSWEECVIGKIQGGQRPVDQAGMRVRSQITRDHGRYIHAWRFVFSCSILRTRTVAGLQRLLWLPQHRSDSRIRPPRSKPY